MKRSSILLPIFALAMMASCSKDNVPADAPNVGPDGPKDAYVSVQVKSVGTRADLPEEEGTQEESSVNSIMLLTFDRSHDYIGPSESDVPTGDNKFVLEVSPSAYYFFAIANPTEAIEAALKNVNGNWNTVDMALQTALSIESRIDLDKYMSDNSFVMVNAGSYVGNKESVLVRPADSEFTDDKLSIDKTNPSHISINVDRLAARFDANIGDSFLVKDLTTSGTSTDNSGVVGLESDPGLYGKIEGVRLNVVNRKSYIYSHINAVNGAGDDYRADPNMNVKGEAAKPKDQSTALTENFLWLHNYESPVFNTIANSKEYVFENTAEGKYCDYNNLTQLVVKATYRPTGQNNGMSTILNHDTADKNTWFAVNMNSLGTFQMTFSGLVDFYSALRGTNPVYGTSYMDTATADKMDRQLQHMLSQANDLNGIDAATATWDNANLNCTVLNSIPNGGYVAATVADEEDYIVQFYQFGLNYYDIFIQHFDLDEIATGYLGRWGMVRNNSYTLTINSLTGPGLPYIPDPTDPDIKDPKNPDPTDPEHADKDMAYIEATIDANPWTMWTQGVDLN